MQRGVGRIVALAAVVGLVAAACSSDDDTGGTTSATEAPATSGAPATSSASTAPSSSDAGATTAAPASGGSDVAAKVMVIGDETSTIAFTVADSVPAVEGALQDYPNVEVLSCDSKGDANAASQCQRDAVSQEVDVVISSFGNLSQDASILAEAGIPVVGSIGDATAPNAFGTSSSLGAYSGLGVGAAEGGCTKAGILFLEGTDFLADMLKTGLESGGATEAARAAVPATAPDLAPAVARLLQAGSDCILLSVTPPMVVQAVTAINQSGESPMIAAVGAIFPKEIRDALGDLANGVLTTEIQLNPADDAPVIAEINEDMAAFDDDAELTTIGIQSWASAKVIGAALETVDGEVTPASLTVALDGLRDVDLHGAIHDFSAVPIASKSFPRFFNHYGINYVIEDGVPVRQGDEFYDLAPVLETQ